MQIGLTRRLRLKPKRRARKPVRQPTAVVVAQAGEEWEDVETLNMYLFGYLLGC
ncbi:MAG: hypothetical protein ABWW70_01400 [Thermoproteota archaeon]